MYTSYVATILLSMCMHYSGTSFIRTSINRTLHLPSFLDSQKLFRYSHVKIINMASNSSLGSDVVDIIIYPVRNVKEKLCLLKRSWKYVVDMKWDNCIFLYQRNMVSDNLLYMTLFKVRIN